MDLLNNMHNKDCFDFLKEIENEKIDIIVTDPPYNILSEKWDSFTEEEFKNFTIRYLNEFYRVLKPNTACYLFWSQKYIEMFFKLIKETEFKEIKRLLIWHHKNLCITTKNSYIYSYDPIFLIYKGKPKFQAMFSLKENVDVFEYAKPQSNFIRDKRIHLCQKPVELIKKLIIPTTKENDIVLDPFLGSGTTAISSIELKRNFLGCELDKSMYDKSIDRINNFNFTK